MSAPVRAAAGDRLPEIRHPVTASTVVLGAAASRDWRPVHHDRDAAAAIGLRDIFLDTQTQLAWLQRCVTDWTGPGGRLGRLALRMHGPVHPGDEMVVGGTVEGVEIGRASCRERVYSNV